MYSGAPSHRRARRNRRKVETLNTFDHDDRTPIHRVEELTGSQGGYYLKSALRLRTTTKKQLYFLTAFQTTQNNPSKGLLLTSLFLQSILDFKAGSKVATTACQAGGAVKVPIFEPPYATSSRNFPESS